MAKPHVVIIGAGFGGLSAARAFEFSNVNVTVIDRQNHHLFQPLLYQVATAALSSPDISAPIRKLLKDQNNTRVLMSEVVDIDRENRVVHTADLQVEYDYLILAAGMQNNYFGNDHWQERAPGLKTLADAIEIRRRVLLSYEHAELAATDEDRAAWLTFVVIGGGATGVEVAGALREIAGRTLARNFRSFDASSARVHLIEGQDCLLGGMPSASLRRSALAQLQSLGVQVHLKTLVKEIGDDFVLTNSGERIGARTVVWAAGVKAESIADKLHSEQDRGGRLVVGANLTLPDDEHVYVIGDIAACTDGRGEAVPGLAPAAIQMGDHAAMNIKRHIAGSDALPYKYVDKGQMATIGRSRAVAMSGPLQMTGLVAWLAWLFIHLMYLVGFRNRIAVLAEWAWAYISFQRSARVVVTSRRRLGAPESTALLVGARVEEAE